MPKLEFGHKTSVLATLLWRSDRKFVHGAQLLFARAGGLVELELAGIADFDNDRTLAGIALLVEAHLTGDTIEILDVSQRFSNAGPVGCDVTADCATILYRFLNALDCMDSSFLQLHEPSCPFQ